ncbi:hypothetical protein [Rhizorhabdus dicambivorans]|uniref:Uncharacterized protein n=1 Tax=Rhizorhabdus dicambivorans TaxID=1850238 RepID=A0A2A4G0M7_9SPHN|nr:hypothetical protein [Rhizorhabdus dicambivorans]ATE63345.1 hypothetical protein CMV14_02135 [Rhizorhabdus dicambivorans]PCE43559.1 hypothetical protein COO09_04455 [Rhizorhabdus dicambivorans]
MVEEQTLDPARRWWVPAVTAPCRDWAGRPGCRKGARYLVGETSFAATTEGYPVFESRADCLMWIMRHRTELAHAAPDTPVQAVDLAKWMLGLS